MQTDTINITVLTHQMLSCKIYKCQILCTGPTVQPIRRMQELLTEKSRKSSTNISEIQLAYHYWPSAIGECWMHFRSHLSYLDPTSRANILHQVSVQPGPCLMADVGRVSSGCILQRTKLKKKIGPQAKKVGLTTLFTNFNIEMIELTCTYEKWPPNWCARISAQLYTRNGRK